MLYFIVNEKSRSGRGAQIWKEVQRELVKRGIHYRHYVTEHEGHATRLAVEICAKTDDDICLAVVGGDGTANEVINGITHPEKVRFGLQVLALMLNWLRSGTRAGGTVISKLIQRLPPWAWGSGIRCPTLKRTSPLACWRSAGALLNPSLTRALEMKIGTMKFSFRSQTAV